MKIVRTTGGGRPYDYRFFVGMTAPGHPQIKLAGVSRITTGRNAMYEMPVRKFIRLMNYDYSQAGIYFVTICVRDRRELFGKVVGTADHGEQLEYAIAYPFVKLSALGECVDKTIHIANKNEYKTRIDKYVIMPNHLHMIVIQEYGTDDRGRSSLQQIVRNIKSYVTKWAGFPVWQPRFYDHIIRSESEYRRVWQYIDENPATWRDDDYYNNNK